MGRGGARPGAGRPRASLETLALRGSVRPARHANRLAVATAAHYSNENTNWQPTPADLAALQDTGRAFVAHHLAAYDVTAAEGQLLIEWAQIADRLADLRVRRGASLSVKESLALDRVEQGWSRLFLSFGTQLKAETP